MKLAIWLAMLASAVALGFVGAPARAAPAEGLHALAAPAAHATNVQKADWYRRHYYRYDYRPRYDYYYGPRYHRHWHHRHWHRW